LVGIKVLKLVKLAIASNFHDIVLLEKYPTLVRFCQNTKALHDRATIFRPSEKRTLIPVENKRFYGNGEYLTGN